MGANFFCFRRKSRVLGAEEASLGAFRKREHESERMHAAKGIVALSRRALRGCSGVALLAVKRHQAVPRQSFNLPW